VSIEGAGLSRGEPWGRRLWLTLAAVVLATACLTTYGISTWPMADDEVPSLVELGLLEIDAPAFFSVPASQIGKLPKATIVWNTYQRLAIGLLPESEVSYRIPSVVCAVLTAALSFLLAARWRGLQFGVALSILLVASQSFIYLAQLNRFYSLALLFVTLTLAAICLPRGRTSMIFAAAVLAALAVLSHNVTVAVFVLLFVAACLAYLLGSVSLQTVLRSAAAAAAGVLLYFLYLRPLVQGWASTGNPTPVLVSFAAHAGMPTLALALLGAWQTILGHDSWRTLRTRLWNRALNSPPDLMIWWTLVFIGSVCAFQVATISWNPRYFIFFMPAVWVLAAHSMEAIARAVQSRGIAAAWYATVALLLAPALLSHYQDGSRHDYRRAASVVRAYAQNGQQILSDDAETISYYLPPEFQRRLHVRTKVKEFPSSEFLLVCRSNAWLPPPQVPDRRIDLLAEISRRRFDHFSHILRVYRVAPADGLRATKVNRQADIASSSTTPNGVRGGS
jgi:hypothetical protein